VAHDLLNTDSFARLLPAATQRGCVMTAMTAQLTFCDQFVMMMMR
jgi:hypothetical protein